MNQIIVNADLSAVGLRVTRGPGWEWGDQDGGIGSAGTIADEPTADGWVSVQWNRGGIYSYRIGAEGKYDLAMYNPFESTAMQLTNKKEKVVPQRIHGIRQAMEQSIDRAKSLIDKSNTKHGNSNNTTGSYTGAIKVRRSISKIQGTKG